MKPNELIGKEIEIQLTDIIEMPDDWVAVIYGDDVWFTGVIKDIVDEIIYFEITKVNSSGIMKIKLNRVKYVEYEGNTYKFIPLLTYTEGRLSYGEFERITA